MPDQHPRWCDPRVCDCDGASVDHRAAPLTWRVAGDDADVAVGLARLDPHDVPGPPGDTTVMLTLELRPTRVEVSLTAADARMLAGVLASTAERAGAAAAARAVT